MDSFKKICDWLKTLPFWARCLAAAIAAMVVLVCSSGCAQLVRVTVKDTPNGVSITTTQTKKDSAGTNISITPNIHLNGSPESK